MHTTVKVLLASILAVGLVACSDASDNKNDDAGVDKDVGGSVESYKINFELKNESGAPVYAYRSVEELGACSYGVKSWLSIERDGKVVKAGTDCSFCICGEECSICDPNCEGPPNSSRAALADGEMRSFTWDGRVWVEDVENRCLAPEVAAGETLKATICYGVEFLDGENEHDGKIADPICETIAFTLDKAEQTVRVIVPGA